MDIQDLIKNYQPIRRLRYFLYQMLLDTDFADEQVYHRNMRCLHNAALHGSGTVGGLIASKVDRNGVQMIAVEPGIAIDDLGREVVLASRVEIQPTGKQDDKIYVKLTQSEEGHEPQEIGDRKENTRIVEKGIVTVDANEPDPNEDVVLAWFTLQASGGIPDQLSTEGVARAGTVARLSEVERSLDALRPTITELVPPSARKGSIPPTITIVGKHLFLVDEIWIADERKSPRNVLWEPESGELPRSPNSQMALKMEAQTNWTSGKYRFTIKSPFGEDSHVFTVT